MVLRCSTSAVPIGGSRLFRPKVIGEGEESVSAVTALKIPAARPICESKVATTQSDEKFGKPSPQLGVLRRDFQTRGSKEGFFPPLNFTNVTLQLNQQNDLIQFCISLKLK